ncbi:MAG: nucleotidyltransferase domain-containing protein [Candidatus Paceibacterota bacterium]
MLDKSKIETDLVLVRENLLKKLKNLFRGREIEAHIFGSLARQQADPFSDIDIWFTFSDDDFTEIYNKRFEYYKGLGDIVHSCEAPQNAPENGVHTALIIYSPQNVMVVVDIYLCPQSTAYITGEGKKLYGIDLPVGTTDFNPQKVAVDKDYRLDFFINFIFNTIKKLVRHEQNPLKDLFQQYEHLHKNYGITVEELSNREQVVETLETVIKNIQKIANDKQKETLINIRDFARKVLV